MSARRSWIRWGGVAAALCALSLLSCKEAVMEPLTVAAVEVAGGGVNLRLGQTAQLTPTLKSAKGYLLPKVGVVWSSSDGAKASISSSGQVTAVSRGPVTLTASAGGVSGTAAVTVIGVQSISLAPETLSVIVTQTRAMTATTVLDPGVTVTPTWRGLDTTIARVGTDGRVTATSTTGIARIEVTAEDKKDTAVVRVVPVPVVSVVVSPDTATRTVGQTLQLTATPKDSIGGTLTGRVVTWSSSDTSRASVSTSGLVTVKAAGTATITGAVEGKSGSAGLTLKVPVADVTVTQSSCTGSGSLSGGTGRLYTSETCEYGALVRDVAGNSLTDRTVTWTSSDTAVAKIDGAPFAHPTTKVSTVKLLPRKAGTIALTAAVEGKSTSASLSVLVPVASVTVSPATATLAIGATQQLTATPKDSLGGTLTGRTVTWSSSDTTKAVVSSTGLVTARAVGSATIRATSEGKTGEASLTIAGYIVPENIPITGLVAYWPFSGDARDGSGNGNTGIVVGASLFPDRDNTPNSSYDFNGTNNLIRVPASTSIDQIESKNEISVSLWFKVRGYPSSVIPLLERHNVASDGGWALLYHSSFGLVFSYDNYVNINATKCEPTIQLNRWHHVGFSYSKSAGRYSFSFDGVLICSGSANNSLTTTRGDLILGASPNGPDEYLDGNLDDVALWSRALSDTELLGLYARNQPVAAVQVTPATATLAIGATQQLTATLKDSLGGTLTGRTVTWSSSDTVKATVSSTGLVTAKAVGSATITATSEGKSGSSAFTISSSPQVNAIELSPPGSLQFIGETVQLSAIARDQAGNAINDKAFSWQSTASTVATVSSAGLVTAISPGIARIIASGDGKADTSVVQVEPTTWSLVGHMSNSGGMFDGDCDLSRTCNCGTFVASPTPSTPDFWRAAPFTESQADILFLSGDRRVWGKADYGQLITAIQSRLGTLSPNITFESGINGLVGTSTGNVLSRTGNIEDPWIGLRGSHEASKSDSLIVWGEYNYCEPPGVCNHVDLKNTRGGVNVFLRPRAAIDTGLIARFAISSGSINDVSGNGRLAVLKGGTWVRDRFGIDSSAIEFDGLSGGITTADSVLSLGQQEYTIAFWFSSLDASWNCNCVAGLIGSNPHTGIGFGFDANVSGSSSLALGDGLTFWKLLYHRGTKTDWTINRWYHVVLRKQGTQYQVFVDGTVVHDVSLSAASSFSKRAMLSFGANWQDSQVSKARIDDIRIFRRAITVAEISALSAERP